jgi:hypothetical protein
MPTHKLLVFVILFALLLGHVTALSCFTLISARRFNTSCVSGLSVNGASGPLAARSAALRELVAAGSRIAPVND